MTFWWQLESERSRIRKKETTNSTSGIFLSIQKKKALIIILQFFKGFFLSGSIKTFDSFEDFFFDVQFWIFVSEIWIEEFFKDAKQIFNYIDLENWFSNKIS